MKHRSGGSENLSVVIGVHLWPKMHCVEPLCDLIDTTTLLVVPIVGFLQRGDIDLVHLEHRAHHPLGFGGILVR